MRLNNNLTAEPFRMRGNWPLQARILKDKFSSLTDEDLTFEKGKEEELLARIERRISVHREEVINILRSGQPL